MAYESDLFSVAEAEIAAPGELEAGHCGGCVGCSGCKHIVD